jgi:hypothetical protein
MGASGQGRLRWGWSHEIQLHPPDRVVGDFEHRELHSVLAERGTRLGQSAEDVKGVAADGCDLAVGRQVQVEAFVQVFQG